MKKNQKNKKEDMLEHLNFLDIMPREVLLGLAKCYHYILWDILWKDMYEVQRKRTQNLLKKKE